MKSTKYKTPPPSHDGLLPEMERLNCDYRICYADILGNHYLGPVYSPHTIDLTIEFTQIDNTGYYKFSRYEENGTGYGMNKETVSGPFYGKLTNDQLNALSNVGPNAYLSVHGLGETMSHIQLTKDVPDDMLGFEILTKLQEDEDYLHSIYNPRDPNNWIVEPTRISYDEASDELRAIMDRIGDKGTYSSYVVNTQLLDENWYELLIEYVSNIFAGYLDNSTCNPIYNLVFKLTRGGILLDETKLQSKIIAYIPEANKSDYTQPTTHGNFTIGHKSFSYTIGKRPMKGSGEEKNFDTMYPGRRALKADGLIVPLARHMCLILSDKNTGYIYSVKKIPVSGGSGLERVVVKINVDKTDLETDTAKGTANLRGANGKSIAMNVLHREVLTHIARPTFEYSETVREEDLQKQLVAVLTGEKVIPAMTYRELARDLDIPLSSDGTLEESFEYCKKNIQQEFAVGGVRKYIDVINMDTVHIMELKNGEPDADKDLNQILAYGFVTPDVEKVTTLAVSSPSMSVPTSPTSNFKDTKVGKFSTDLNNHPQTKHIEWKLLDLRYYGLHVII